MSNRKQITVPAWAVDELGTTRAQEIVNRVKSEALAANMTDTMARTLAVETLEHEATETFNARMAKAWGVRC
jgi:hypothetical protein